MEKTFQTLNDLEAAGLVTRYAIGGAMAAFFYAEAVVTEDLDAFVLLAAPASGLVTLTPIYDFLKAGGATERRAHLVIAGTLVQIIPGYDALTTEAVEQAVERQVGQTPTRVMRAKDHARVAMLLEEADVDSAALLDILQRHDLTGQWKQFKNVKP